MNGPEREAPPMVYMSIDQGPDPVNNIRVRAVGDPRQLSDSVVQALHEVDPTLPIDEIVPFSTELNGGLGTEKLLARLAGVYAGLTLLLVAIGFYGVMSSRTSRRKSEFGIRLALGATRGNIQMLIVGQTVADPACRRSARRIGYRFSRCAQQGLYCTGRSAQIPSPSLRQALCSYLPVCRHHHSRSSSSICRSFGDASQ